MNKVELLSPVGDLESLYQAIHNGADAVYLSGKLYGARKFAENFDEEGLIYAIEYCHLYGVKIYITVNTIIYDNEIDEFLKYIEFLYNNNVDAVIMQDIGMIRKVRSLFPNLEIHASTQMHNHNLEGINILESLGVKRVVLARELSLEQINNINCNLEKEVFVHGALCICYSGCCLFSSLTNGRSGNRGECVASCRLPYKLIQNNEIVKINGKYILSTKELNTINDIPRLIESGIDSLKIEGRMKSSYYVGFITRLYKEAINNYYEGKNYTLTTEKLKQLMSLYNREFTKSFLFGDYGKKLMNIKAPNHQGIPLGKVIEVNKNKIKIHLSEDLSQEDGIRFATYDKGMIVNKLYNEKGLLVTCIKNGNIAVIDNKVGLKDKDIVNKTIDKNLINELSNLKEKKIKLNIEINARLNNFLEIILTDLDNNKVVCRLDCICKAINSPLTKEDIKKQIIKLGNTPFELNNLNIDMDDDIFIQNKMLNQIRREAVEKLIDLRKHKTITNKHNKSINITSRNISLEKTNINVLVRTEQQLKAVIDMNIDNIYITDYSLYKKYKNNNIYYVLPRVCEKYLNYENENLLVREIGSINKYVKNNNLISDYTLNVSNIESVKLLNDLGVNRICISPEVDLDNFVNNNYNTEVVVYGRLELMITKYCVVNMLLNKDSKKCVLCKNNKYSLIDDKERIYPLSHQNHFTTIYDYKNINLFSKIKNLKGKINNIRINLFDEDYENVIKIIRECRSFYE